MASKRRKSKKSKSGSTFYGLVFGLVLGVAAAATVAIFVTQVPMPFNDKASRDPAKTLLPGVRDAPDPNTGLYGKDAPAGTVANGPTVTNTTPMPPGTGTAVNGQTSGKTKGGKSDDLGTLIANLGTSKNTSKTASGSSAPAATATSTSSVGKKASTAATEQNTYYLQAGAYHSKKDADGVKARIIMMGLSVKVQTAKVNGDTINRVRVGPFKGIDAMNAARAKLGTEKIESSVVRQ